MKTNMLCALTIISLVLCGCSDGTGSGNPDSCNQDSGNPDTQTGPDLKEPPADLTGDVTGDERTLLGDIQKAKGVAWVGPHCDDDLFVSHFLAMASLGYGKKTYVLSLNKDATSFPPGATLDDRHQDNDDVKEYLNLADYIRIGLTISNPENEQMILDYMDKFVADNGVDLIMTFEPTNGGNGQSAHKSLSKLLTPWAEEKGLMYYYVIQRDPLFSSNPDPLPITDTWDLDAHEITGMDDIQRTLWQVSVDVLHIYKSSVPSALNIVNSKLDQFQHEANFRMVCCL